MALRLCFLTTLENDASLWVAIAAFLGLWWIALRLLAMRLPMGLVCGCLQLGSADVWKYCYAIPLRDLCGVAVWAAGLVRDRVLSRYQRLKLDAEGKILEAERSVHLL
jgi:hypothetical protein